MRPVGLEIRLGVFAAKGELPAAEGDKAPFTVKAIEGGAAGDNITLEVADASEPSDENFKLIVRSPGSATARLASDTSASSTTGETPKATSVR